MREIIEDRSVLGKSACCICVHKSSFPDLCSQFHTSDILPVHHFIDLGLVHVVQYIYMSIHTLYYFDTTAYFHSIDILSPSCKYAVEHGQKCRQGETKLVLTIKSTYYQSFFQCN